MMKHPVSVGMLVSMTNQSCPVLQISDAGNARQGSEESKDETHAETREKLFSSTHISLKAGS
mgnify:CR=1 FL=1